MSRIVHLISALHTYQIGRRLDVLDILFDLETQLVHGTERDVRASGRGMKYQTSPAWFSLGIWKL